MRTLEACWSEISPLLDEAMELPASARESWLADLEQRSPEQAAHVRSCLSQVADLSDRKFLEDPIRRYLPPGLEGRAFGAYTLDAGIEGDRQPYLFLEYVRGEPIDKYCKRNDLRIEQRIRLFLDVLAAVVEHVPRGSARRVHDLRHRAHELRLQCRSGVRRHTDCRCNGGAARHADGTFRAGDPVRRKPELRDAHGVSDESARHERRRLSLRGFRAGRSAARQC